MAQITVASGRCWQYSHYIGRQGGAGTGFSSPIGVAVGKDDMLYVANRAAPRITKTTVDQEFIAEFGRGAVQANVFGGPAVSEQENPFVWLTGIALDKDENIYTTDEWLNRVTVMNKDGEILGMWGEQGEAEGQFNGPSGLAFDAQDNVWIVNSKSSRVQKFDKDGKYLGGFGRQGNGEGELDLPWGIAIDNEGDIYVADWNNHRVQKFNTDGTHVLTFGSGKRVGISPDGGTPYSHTYQSHVAVNPRDLNHPTGVAVDGDGDVYVVDWMNERVVIFDAQADPVATLRGDASGLSKWAEMSLAANPDMEKAFRRVKTPEIQNYFRMPVGCTFDQANNRLLVCDTLRSRVQVYHKDDNYMDPQFNL
jgi:sugar lactone lactonase YvrE